MNEYCTNKLSREISDGIELGEMPPPLPKMFKTYNSDTVVVCWQHHGIVQVGIRYRRC